MHRCIKKINQNCTVNKHAGHIGEDNMEPKNVVRMHNYVDTVKSNYLMAYANMKDLMMQGQR